MVHNRSFDSIYQYTFMYKSCFYVDNNSLRKIWVLVFMHFLLSLKWASFKLPTSYLFEGILAHQTWGFSAKIMPLTLRKTTFCTMHQFAVNGIKEELVCSITGITRGLISGLNFHGSKIAGFVTFWQGAVAISGQLQQQ